MGYSKLTYDEYMNNYEYWIEQGVPYHQYTKNLVKTLDNVCTKVKKQY